MASLRRMACAVLAVFLFLSGEAPARSLAAPLSVREIRCRTESDHTRVVLDMSGAARYSVRALSDPHRIVIDIPSCQASAKAKGREIGDGVLDRLRVNRMKTGLQIVLDLPRKTEVYHFALKPASGKPHRIVIDLAKPSAAGKAAAKPEETAKAARSGDFVVIIDPGHGGGLPGCVSRSGIEEKTLTLKLAKMLKAEIERRPGHRVILVRDGDYDVHWHRRVTMARESGGDVFVSLHFNANRSQDTRGIELYFLSLEGASDENAEAVAEQENLLLEAGADSANFNDDLKSILFDVSRSNAMHQSSILAEEVASVLRHDSPVPFRKIKQANFIVLRGIAMPSILVEGGYLSNRKEAAFVSKESYLRWLAKSLADGIATFLEKHPRVESAAGT